MAVYNYVYERPARKHFRWWWNNIARIFDQDGNAFASLEDATEEVLSLLFP
jgi:hypothetical protein